MPKECKSTLVEEEQKIVKLLWAVQEHAFQRIWPSLTTQYSIITSAFEASE